MKAKHYLYTSTILLLTSCHTYQEKYRRERSSYIALDSSYDFRYGYQSNQRDTFGRRWYFYTDSSFHYHADSGLDARSGWLLLFEHGKSENDLAQVAQQQMELNVEQESNHSFSHQTKLNILYVLLGLIGAVLVVWFLRR